MRHEYPQPIEVTGIEKSERTARTLLAGQRSFQYGDERIDDLQDTVTQFEARFGISSDDVHDAIENKTLVETEEVCDWIMAYELLQRIQGR